MVIFWSRKICVRILSERKVGGQAVLGRQSAYATPWLTERHGYDPTCWINGAGSWQLNPLHGVMRKVWLKGKW